MAEKIYISPSDQTNNTYAGTSTNEAVQCRKIGKALETALERCGFVSKCNTTSGMYKRIEESNKGKYDLHVCIHTNAFNKKVTGTRIFVYKTTGEAYQIAQSIFKQLAPLTPGTSESISVNQTWAEIIKTNAPCVYIEVDFHDVKDVAKWIVEHTSDIAEAIAKGICNHYEVKYIPPITSTAPVKKKTFNVKVNTDVLNVRAGAGADNKKVGTVEKGEAYTIVETKLKDGVEWGRLKFGIGWISLKYTVKI